MPEVNIVGIGTGDRKTITREAEEAVRNSSLLIGDRRVLRLFEDLKIPMFYSSSPGEISNCLESCGEDETVSVLVSGDVGFYSLAKLLIDKSKQKEKIKLICGISSLQYFCARHKISWEDVAVLSLHGREGSLISKVMNNKTLFILTGGKNTPDEVCRQLCRYGLGQLKVSVGERLSYPEEKITTGTAESLAQETFQSLSVMLVFNPRPLEKEFAVPGLPDERFIRGDVPMTKQEVRSIVISKLQIRSTDTVFDIGAGTGSVAVECALQANEGLVYALEKDSKAVSLLNKNKEKFGVSNLNIVHSTAPVGLKDLPRPDKVFIGGSGGNLEEILDVLYTHNPSVRIVLTAITLETLNKAVNYYKEKPEIETEIINIAVTKTRKLGEYHAFASQNPVFVITAYKI